MVKKVGDDAKRDAKKRPVVGILVIPCPCVLAAAKQPTGTTSTKVALGADPRYRDNWDRIFGNASLN